jgi:hypothetical protein
MHYGRSNHRVGLQGYEIQKGGVEDAEQDHHKDAKDRVLGKIVALQD